MKNIIRRAFIACLIMAYAVIAPVAGTAAENRVSNGLIGDFVCDCQDDMAEANLQPEFMNKSLKSTAKRIVESVRKLGMNEYDLALALNDWLMDHTRYKSHVTGALNVLNYGYASCSGYANAYCALLDAAMIGHKRITGKVYRFDHVWNLVKLDGEWYHVDVRMNDSSQSHTFFGLTHEAIGYNHQAFSRKKDCSAYRNNYDYVNGTYDEALEFINAAIEENFSKGAAAFMISLRDEKCPEALKNPIYARMIKCVVEKGLYEFMGGRHAVTFSILDDAVAVYVDKPFVKISSITLDQKKIKVVIPDLSANRETYKLKATVLPENATNGVIFWRSRNEKVALVDQQGTVTIVGYGKARIAAMAEDGSKKQCECEFTVKKK